MSKTLMCISDRFQLRIQQMLIAVLAILAILLGMGEAMADKKDIVYIEASTVSRWKLGEFGKRVHDERFSIETMTVYDFDKTPRVKKALDERPSKPNAIIMQECSVYFPGDMQAYKQKYHSWIRQIKQTGVAPVIATTVPPAASQGFVEDVKDWIKVGLLGRDSQYAQVVQFNDWLRQLAKDENVVLFDLEKVTRKNDTDRHMREEFNAGDGIHLNAVAYRKLDSELLSLLKTLK
jgi:hypothetical protein